MMPVGAARRGAERVRGRGVDDQVRVELAEGEDWGSGVAGDGLGQEAPVAQNVGAVVAFGKAEIQLARRVAGAVGAAHASFPGAESGPKPGKIPAGNREPLDAVGGAAAGGARRAQFFGSAAVGAGRPGAVASRATRIAHEPCLPKEGVKGFECRRSGGWMG